MNTILFFEDFACPSRDIQVKTMEQTVLHAEKYLGEICSLLASYTRKTAKLRDTADKLVAQLFDFSRTEDPELQVGLKNLAEDLAMVQDYRQAEIERLETRVIGPLKAYGDTVKNKRTDLKNFNTDLKRELKQLQKLEKIRLRNPADQQSIRQSQISRDRNWRISKSVSYIYTCMLHAFILQLVKHQRLSDRLCFWQRIFTDFITVEMLFHAKALEVYTHTYHNLEEVNTEKDLEVAYARLLSTTLNSHSSPLMSHHPSPPPASLEGQTLRSMLAFATGQSHRQQHSQTPDRARRVSMNASVRIITESEGVLRTKQQL
uniref:Family with sequence similarity 92 member A1 n=1 Tax=Acanthochromis polyacanthus TaxID=80966 RepID=A0A3Q1G0N4_9TELE